MTLITIQDIMFLEIWRRQTLIPKQFFKTEEDNGHILYQLCDGHYLILIDIPKLLIFTFVNYAKLKLMEVILSLALMIMLVLQQISF